MIGSELITMEDISIGDWVLLKWNGYPEVPKWLSGSKVKVIGFTKTKVKTLYWDEHRYTVRLDQIVKVIKE